ncbi:sugar ABC transporter permease, partial [Thioclava sp. BHET1]
GYVWAVLEPMSIIMILSLVISSLLERPALGQSFLLFYATGYLPYHYFNQASEQASSAIAVNRELMQMPGVTPLIAIFARFVLTTLTFSVVAAIILTVVAQTLRYPLYIEPNRMVEAFMVTGLLGLGLGVLNSVVFTFVPVWRQFWGVIRAPLLIFSGVFFSYNSLPASVQDILWWNPVLHCIGAMREAFYPGYNGGYISLGYALGVAVTMLLVGLALLYRFTSTVINTRY